MQLDEILPFGKKLNEAQRALLRGAVHERRFAQGAVIQSTSENCVGLLAIMEGQLRVYTVSDEGRELTLYRLLNGISVFFRDLHYGKPAIRRFDPRAAGYRRAAHPPDVYKRLMQESAPVANYTNELMASRFQT